MPLKRLHALRRTARAFPLTSLCLLSWGCLALAAALESSGGVPSFWIVALLPAYLSGLVVHLAGGLLWGLGAEPGWLPGVAVALSLLAPLAADLALRMLVWREPRRRVSRRA